MRRWLLAMLCLGLLTPEAAASAQAVVGRVTDGATGQALAGTTVLLLDASLEPIQRTASGPDGAYRLNADRRGTFFVLAERPGYAGPLSDPIPLQAEELYDLPLTLVPLEREADGTGVEPTVVARLQDVAGACRGRFDAKTEGIVVGHVLDRLTGTTLTGVWVEVDGAAGGRSPVPPREVRSDVDGLFLFCGVPSGTTRLRVAVDGIRGPGVAVDVGPGAVKMIDLGVPLAGAGRAGQVVGRVTDDANGQGIEGAEIHVAGSGQSVLSDLRGNFALDSVPAGLQEVAVSRLGYAPRRLTLAVAGGRAHTLRIPLSQQAVALRPIVVTVRSSRWGREMRDLQDRMRHSPGAFFTREDLERLRPARLLDLLREVPGLRVVADAGDQPAFEVRGRRCRPDVVVDRVHDADARRLATLRAGDLEAVEVYRGAAEAPRVFGSGASCAAIVIWTRGGWS